MTSMNDTDASTCQHCNKPVHWEHKTEQGFGGFVHDETGVSACAAMPMRIIVRNVEPRYMLSIGAPADGPLWCNERSNALEFDTASADRIVGRLAGRYDIVTEEA